MSHTVCCNSCCNTKAISLWKLLWRKYSDYFINDFNHKRLVLPVIFISLSTEYTYYSCLQLCVFMEWDGLFDGHQIGSKPFHSFGWLIFCDDITSHTCHIWTNPSTRQWEECSLRRSTDLLLCYSPQVSVKIFFVSLFLLFKRLYICVVGLKFFFIKLSNYFVCKIGKKEIPELFLVGEHSKCFHTGFFVFKFVSKDNLRPEDLLPSCLIGSLKFMWFAGDQVCFWFSF